MVNFIPYIIIGGVFVGNRMVEQMEKTESTGNLPERSESKKENSGNMDWRKVRLTLSVEEVTNIAYAKTEDIMKAFPGLSERTARNWRTHAREEINIPQ
jgi:hypothetical protein